MPDPTVPPARHSTPAAASGDAGPGLVSPAAAAVGTGGAVGGRKVLERMLDRLFAALVSGPGMNCRPHRSRQRVDWFSLSALNDVAPAEALRELLGEDRKVTLRARPPGGKGAPTSKDVAAGKDAPGGKETVVGKRSGGKRGAEERTDERGTPRGAAADAGAPDRATLAAERGDAGGTPDDEVLTDQPTESANLAKPQAAAGSVARAEHFGGLEGEEGFEGEGSDPLSSDPLSSNPAHTPSELKSEPESSPSASSAPSPKVGPSDEGNETDPGDADPRDGQVALLQKLHIIAEDARTYEQDTGVHVLNVGFPLLSLPPAFAGGNPAGGRQSTRRILAPIAYIPVSLTLRRGATRIVEVACRGEGIDLVQPNTALLAWLQRQTGNPATIGNPTTAGNASQPSSTPPAGNGAAVGTAGELFADEKGEDPWREIRELVQQVCRMVDLPVPPGFESDPAVGDAATKNVGTAESALTPGAVPPGSSSTEGAGAPAGPGGIAPGVGDAPTGTRPIGAAAAEPVDAPAAPDLRPTPSTDDLDGGPEILSTAVLGLFPVANQGLLRDAQALADDPAKATGPLERFVRLGALLDAPAPAAPRPLAGTVGPDSVAMNVVPSGVDAASAAVPAAAKQETSSATPATGAITSAAADDRLVADADPCQARAVRLARHSPALVIHGPPGTGKSQTIANIIGDHLARGQRVLFVCEKRTALDVVAGRLEHMGLGDLVGVVHDPQRDQRDLYRQIREQLERLPERTTDPRAADRLRQTDAELQALRAELTGYQAALTRLDPETGHSFHELMGQWLAASPTSVVGGDDGERAAVKSHDRKGVVESVGSVLANDVAVEESASPTSAVGRHASPDRKSAEPTRLPPRDLRAPTLLTPPLPHGRGSLNASISSALTVSPAAAADLTKARLRDLAPLEHPLGELFSRARRVGYADNPWSTAVGVSLAGLLSKPIEQHRSAVAAVVSAAAVADETCRDREPALPPFAQGIGLTAQAEARDELADQLGQMLDQCPPDVLDRWAARPIADVRPARAKLTEIHPYLAALESQPVDRTLAPRWLAAVGMDLPDVASLSAQRRTLQAYADAFATSMAWVDEIKRKAPRSTWRTTALWVSAESAAGDVVQKKLEAVAPLAERAAAQPLDAELLAQYRRQPIDHGQLLRWQSALETYLPVANALLGFLHGAKKKAAAPAVEFFGLGLSAESATRARDFLAGLRLRIEVWEATVKALGSEALGRNAPAGGPTQLPDDAELLGTFTDHLSVLRVAADLHRPALPAAATAADPTALVNHMVSAELSAAAPVLNALELPQNPDSARQAIVFLAAVAVRVVLQGVNENVLAAPTADGLMDDHDLGVSIRGHMALFDVALAASGDASTRDVWPAVAHALVNRDDLAPLLAGLRLSPKRAADVLILERALATAGLFAPAWLAGVDAELRAGDAFAPAAAALRDRQNTLEDVVRTREALDKLPPAVRPAAGELLTASADAAEAWDVLRRDVLAGEIRRRLASDPQLQDVDGHRLATAFDRYRKLDEKKRQLVRDVIVDRWVHDQKDRLVSDSGKKLSSAGAELGRRLLLRGERAIRLRQVIARGRQIAGGDPLFDVCPVWMVSPETAAQVFPREPIFDVVVFDEASQCRLEEALPVLTRGKRVVIAGDPKQLPPTRFFESAFAASEETDEPTDDQGWFEQQQGEVEDLLTAALGLDAHQSYLDVHYRSKHAALIGFSNEHFYGSRLQPIPGHPSRRPDGPPIRLVKVVGGVYDKRKNEPEADAVVALVKELLAERKPPSIGIACFNMVQRDLIVEKLDDAAAEDAKFAKRLTDARERLGASGIESLFVKNLENVQGDERDHLIVSTTYGPDAGGKFYRRFGPLAMPGGGRRLNVLVTRARQQVHLVTSIPAEAYRSLPEPTDGQTPGGGWLLFAYLRYAEALRREYEEQGVGEGAEVAQGTADEPEASPTASEPTADGPAVRVRPTRTPSAFAEALAHKLAAARGARSDVYWGNDGFCVDLVVRPSATDASGGDESGSTVDHVDAADAPASLGVLCDAARFAPADDLMEWDVFRTGVLEAQGWALHRVWTPHFFRDPAGRATSIVGEAENGE